MKNKILTLVHKLIGKNEPSPPAFFYDFEKRRYEAWQEQIKLRRAV